MDIIICINESLQLTLLSPLKGLSHEIDFKNVDNNLRPWPN